MSGLESHLLEYGYIVVLIGMIFESDATLLTAAFLAHRGYFSFTAVVVIALVTTITMNEVFFWLARTRGCERFERNARKHPRFARVRDWVVRRGTLLVLFSRFIFGLRIAIPAACGVVGMKQVRFSVLNVVGAFLWAFPLSFGALAFGSIFARVTSNPRAYEWWIASALLAGTAAFLAWRGRDVRGVRMALHHPEKLGSDSAVRVIVESERHHPHIAHPHGIAA